MPAPQIPVYTGDTPNRSQAPAEFANNADDWLAYQAPLPSSYNSLSAYLDVLSDQVDSNAIAASVSASIANSAAVAASGAANYIGDWSSASGSASTPSSYTHLGGLWLLKVNLADITLSEPSTINNDWFLLDADFTGFVIPDSGTMIWRSVNEFRANATVTIPLADSVNSGSYLDIYVADKYKNIQVTINRSGSDLFDDGATTDSQLILNFATGGYYRVTSDGSSLLEV